MLRAKIMTENQIRLIQESWKNVIVLSPNFGTLFYQELLKLLPDLSSVFTQSNQINKSSNQPFMQWMNDEIILLKVTNKKSENDNKELTRMIKTYGEDIENIFLALLSQTLGKSLKITLNKAWKSIITHLVERIILVIIVTAKNKNGNIKIKGNKTIMGKDNENSVDQAKALQFADMLAQMEALNKVQAVIEFNMDGTIITANDNFLGAQWVTP